MPTGSSLSKLASWNIESEESHKANTKKSFLDDASAISESLYAPPSSFMPGLGAPQYQPPDPGPIGFAGDVLQNIGAGAAQAFGGLSFTGAEKLGMPEVAQDIRTGTRGIVSSLATTPYANEGADLFQKAADPEWWRTSFSYGLGSTAAFVLPAAAVGVATAAAAVPVAAALGIGVTAAAGLSLVMGALGTAGTESLLNSALAYSDVRERGGSVEEANRVASQVGVDNVVNSIGLELGTLGLGLGVRGLLRAVNKVPLQGVIRGIPEAEVIGAAAKNVAHNAGMRGWTPVVRGGVLMGTEALQEAIQEAQQGEIQRAAEEGRPWDVMRGLTSNDYSDDALAGFMMSLLLGRGGAAGARRMLPDIARGDLASAREAYARGLGEVETPSFLNTFEFNVPTDPAKPMSVGLGAVPQSLIAAGASRELVSPQSLAMPDFSKAQAEEPEPSLASLAPEPLAPVAPEPLASLAPEPVAPRAPEPAIQFAQAPIEPADYQMLQELRAGIVEREQQEFSAVVNRVDAEMRSGAKTIEAIAPNTTNINSQYGTVGYVSDPYEMMRRIEQADPRLQEGSADYDPRYKQAFSSMVGDFAKSRDAESIIDSLRMIINGAFNPRRGEQTTRFMATINRIIAERNAMPGSKVAAEGFNIDNIKIVLSVPSPTVLGQASTGTTYSPMTSIPKESMIRGFRGNKYITLNVVTPYLVAKALELSGAFGTDKRIAKQRASSTFTSSTLNVLAHEILHTAGIIHKDEAGQQASEVTPEQYDRYIQEIMSAVTEDASSFASGGQIAIESLIPTAGLGLEPARGVLGPTYQGLANVYLQASGMEEGKETGLARFASLFSSGYDTWVDNALLRAQQFTGDAPRHGRRKIVSKAERIRSIRDNLRRNLGSGTLGYVGAAAIGSAQGIGPDVWSRSGQAFIRPSTKGGAPGGPTPSAAAVQPSGATEPGAAEPGEPGEPGVAEPGEPGEPGVAEPGAPRAAGDVATFDPDNPDTYPEYQLAIITELFEEFSDSFFINVAGEDEYYEKMARVKRELGKGNAQALARALYQGKDSFLESAAVESIIEEAVALLAARIGNFDTASSGDESLLDNFNVQDFFGGIKDLEASHFDDAGKAKWWGAVPEVANDEKALENISDYELLSNSIRLLVDPQSEAVSKKFSGSKFFTERIQPLFDKHGINWPTFADETGDSIFDGTPYEGAIFPEIVGKIADAAKKPRGPEPREAEPKGAAKALDVSAEETEYMDASIDADYAALQEALAEPGGLEPVPLMLQDHVISYEEVSKVTLLRLEAKPTKYNVTIKLKDGANTFYSPDEFVATVFPEIASIYKEVYGQGEQDPSIIEENGEAVAARWSFDKGDMTLDEFRKKFESTLAPRSFEHSSNSARKTLVKSAMTVENFVLDKIGAENRPTLRKWIGNIARQAQFQIELGRVTGMVFSEATFVKKFNELLRERLTAMSAEGAMLDVDSKELRTKFLAAMNGLTGTQINTLAKASYGTRKIVQDLPSLAYRVESESAGKFTQGVLEYIQAKGHRQEKFALGSTLFISNQFFESIKDPKFMVDGKAAKVTPRDLSRLRGRVGEVVAVSDKGVAVRFDLTDLTLAGTTRVAFGMAEDIEAQTITLNFTSPTYLEYGLIKTQYITNFDETVRIFGMSEPDVAQTVRILDRGIAERGIVTDEVALIDVSKPIKAAIYGVLPDISVRERVRRINKLKDIIKDISLYKVTPESMYDFLELSQERLGRVIEKQRVTIGAITELSNGLAMAKVALNDARNQAKVSKTGNEIVSAEQANVARLETATQILRKYIDTSALIQPGPDLGILSAYINAGDVERINALNKEIQSLETQIAKANVDEMARAEQEDLVQQMLRTQDQKFIDLHVKDITSEKVINDFRAVVKEFVRKIYDFKDGAVREPKFVNEDVIKEFLRAGSDIAKLDASRYIKYADQSNGFDLIEEDSRQFAHDSSVARLIRDIQGATGSALEDLSPEELAQELVTNALAKTAGVGDGNLSLLFKFNDYMESLAGHLSFEGTQRQLRSRLERLESIKSTMSAKTYESQAKGLRGLLRFRGTASVFDVLITVLNSQRVLVAESDIEALDALVESARQAILGFKKSMEAEKSAIAKKIEDARTEISRTNNPVKIKVLTDKIRVLSAEEGGYSGPRMQIRIIRELVIKNKSIREALDHGYIGEKDRPGFINRLISIIDNGAEQLELEENVNKIVGGYLIGTKGYATVKMAIESVRESIEKSLIDLRAKLDGLSPDTLGADAYNARRAELTRAHRNQVAGYKGAITKSEAELSRMHAQAAKEIEAAMAAYNAGKDRDGAVKYSKESIDSILKEATGNFGRIAGIANKSYSMVIDSIAEQHTSSVLASIEKVKQLEERVAEAFVKAWAADKVNKDAFIDEDLNRFYIAQHIISKYGLNYQRGKKSIKRDIYDTAAYLRITSLDLVGSHETNGTSGESYRFNIKFMLNPEILAHPDGFDAKGLRPGIQDTERRRLAINQQVTEIADTINKWWSRDAAGRTEADRTGGTALVAFAMLDEAGENAQFTRGGRIILGGGNEQYRPSNTVAPGLVSELGPEHRVMATLNISDVKDDSSIGAGVESFISKSSDNKSMVIAGTYGRIISAAAGGWWQVQFDPINPDVLDLRQGQLAGIQRPSVLIQSASTTGPRVIAWVRDEDLAVLKQPAVAPHGASILPVQPGGSSAIVRGGWDKTPPGVSSEWRIWHTLFAAIDWLSTDNEKGKYLIGQLFGTSLQRTRSGMGMAQAQRVETLAMMVAEASRDFRALTAGTTAPQALVRPGDSITGDGLGDRVHRGAQMLRAIEYVLNNSGSFGIADDVKDAYLNYYQEAMTIYKARLDGRQNIHTTEPETGLPVIYRQYDGKEVRMRDFTDAQMHDMFSAIRRAYAYTPVGNALYNFISEESSDAEIAARVSEMMVEKERLIAKREDLWKRRAELKKTGSGKEELSAIASELEGVEERIQSIEAEFPVAVHSSTLSPAEIIELLSVPQSAALTDAIVKTFWDHWSDNYRVTWASGKKDSASGARVHPGISYLTTVVDSLDNPILAEEILGKFEAGAPTQFKSLRRGIKTISADIAAIDQKLRDVSKPGSAYTTLNRAFSYLYAGPVIDLHDWFTDDYLKKTWPSIKGANGEQLELKQLIKNYFAEAVLGDPKHAEEFFEIFVDMALLHFMYTEGVAGQSMFHHNNFFLAGVEAPDMIGAPMPLQGQSNTNLNGSQIISEKYVSEFLKQMLEYPAAIVDGIRQLRLRKQVELADARQAFTKLKSASAKKKAQESIDAIESELQSLEARYSYLQKDFKKNEELRKNIESRWNGLGASFKTYNTSLSFAPEVKYTTNEDGISSISFSFDSANTATDDIETYYYGRAYTSTPQFSTKHMAEYNIQELKELRRVFGAELALLSQYQARIGDTREDMNAFRHYIEKARAVRSSEIEKYDEEIVRLNKQVLVLEGLKSSGVASSDPRYRAAAKSVEATRRRIPVGMGVGEYTGYRTWDSASSRMDGDVYQAGLAFGRQLSANGIWAVVQHAGGAAYSVISRPEDASFLITQSTGKVTPEESTGKVAPEESTGKVTPEERTARLFDRARVGATVYSPEYGEGVLVPGREVNAVRLGDTPVKGSATALGAFKSRMGALDITKEMEPQINRVYAVLGALGTGDTLQTAATKLGAAVLEMYSSVGWNGQAEGVASNVSVVVSGLGVALNSIVPVNGYKDGDYVKAIYDSIQTPVVFGARAASRGTSFKYSLAVKFNGQVSAFMMNPADIVLGTADDVVNSSFVVNPKFIPSDMSKRFANASEKISMASQKSVSNKVASIMEWHNQYLANPAKAAENLNALFEYMRGLAFSKAQKDSAQAQRFLESIKEEPGYDAKEREIKAATKSADVMFAEMIVLLTEFISDPVYTGKIYNEIFANEINKLKALAVEPGTNKSDFVQRQRMIGHINAARKRLGDLYGDKAKNTRSYLRAFEPVKEYIDLLALTMERAIPDAPYRNANLDVTPKATQRRSQASLETQVSTEAREVFRALVEEVFASGPADVFADPESYELFGLMLSNGTNASVPLNHESFYETYVKPIGTIDNAGLGKVSAESWKGMGSDEAQAWAAIYEMTKGFGAKGMAMPPAIFRGLDVGDVYKYAVWTAKTAEEIGDIVIAMNKGLLTVYPHYIVERDESISIGNAPNIAATMRDYELAPATNAGYRLERALRTIIDEERVITGLKSQEYSDLIRKAIENMYLDVVKINEANKVALSEYHKMQPYRFKSMYFNTDGSLKPGMISDEDVERIERILASKEESAAGTIIGNAYSHGDNGPAIRAVVADDGMVSPEMTAMAASGDLTNEYRALIVELGDMFPDVSAGNLELAVAMLGMAPEYGGESVSKFLRDIKIEDEPSDTLEALLETAYYNIQVRKEQATPDTGVEVVEQSPAARQIFSFMGSEEPEGGEIYETAEEIIDHWNARSTETGWLIVVPAKDEAGAQEYLVNGIGNNITGEASFISLIFKNKLFAGPTPASNDTAMGRMGARIAELVKAGGAFDEGTQLAFFKVPRRVGNSLAGLGGSAYALEPEHAIGHTSAGEFIKATKVAEKPAKQKKQKKEKKEKEYNDPFGRRAALHWNSKGERVLLSPMWHNASSYYNDSLSTVNYLKTNYPKLIDSEFKEWEYGPDGLMYHAHAHGRQELGALISGAALRMLPLRIFDRKDLRTLFSKFYEDSPTARHSEVDERILFLLEKLGLIETINTRGNVQRGDPAASYRATKGLMDVYTNGSGEIPVHVLPRTVTTGPSARDGQYGKLIGYDDTGRNAYVAFGDGYMDLIEANSLVSSLSDTTSANRLFDKIADKYADFYFEGFFDKKDWDSKIADFKSSVSDFYLEYNSWEDMSAHMVSPAETALAPRLTTKNIANVKTRLVGLEEPKDKNDWWEIATAYRYASLLSGPSAVLEISGGLIKTAMFAGATLGGEAIERAFGTRAELRQSATGSQIKLDDGTFVGWLAGIRAAQQASLMALKTAKLPPGIKLESEHTMLTDVLKSKSKAVNAAANFISLPQRLRFASDIFFISLGENIATYVTAHRQAVREGHVSGTRAYEDAAAYWANTIKHGLYFLPPEAGDSGRLRNRIVSRPVMRPVPGMYVEPVLGVRKENAGARAFAVVEEARNVAHGMIYQGKMPTLDFGFGRVLYNNPIGKILIPFMRTGARIARFGAEMTPGIGQGLLLSDIVRGKYGENESWNTMEGVKNNFWNAFAPSTRDESGAIKAARPTGEAAPVAQRLATQLFGMGLAMTGFTLGLVGLINGNGPDDDKERKAWLEDGNRPWALNAGGTQIDLVRIIGPLAWPVMFGVMLADGVSKRNRAVNDIESPLAEFVTTLGSWTLNQSGLNNFSVMMDSFNDLGDGKALSRTAAQTLVGYTIPMSSGLRWLANMSDSNMRDPQSMLDYFKLYAPQSLIKALGADAVPVKYDFIDEPMPRSFAQRIGAPLVTSSVRPERYDFPAAGASSLQQSTRIRQTQDKFSAYANGEPGSVPPTQADVDLLLMYGFKKKDSRSYTQNKKMNSILRQFAEA